MDVMVSRPIQNLTILKPMCNFENVSHYVICYYRVIFLNFELTDTQFSLKIKVNFKINDFSVEQTDKLSFNYTISNDVEDLEPG